MVLLCQDGVPPFAAFASELSETRTLRYHFYSPIIVSATNKQSVKLEIFFAKGVCSL
jgi:hypothetical protein